MVSRGIDLFRARGAGAIAIRDDNRVGSDRRLDAAEQEIILPAAPGEEERGGAEQDLVGLMAIMVNYFAMQSQEYVLYETGLIKNALKWRNRT